MGAEELKKLYEFGPLLVLGTITLFIGPIGCGKTKRLIEEGRRQKDEKHRRVLYLASSKEQWMRDHLWPLNPELVVKADVILIDDAHLYKDLRRVCLYLAEELGKHVYVSALNTNDIGESQEPVADLLPLVDRVEFLRDSTTTPTFTLITGPMCSSKSGTLLRQYKKETKEKQQCVLVKYALDNRFSSELVASRDPELLEKEIGKGHTLKAHFLSQVVDQLLEPNINVILIDEGQFFLDLFEVSRRLLDNGKRIFVTALNGNFQREPLCPGGAKAPVSNILALLNDIQFRTAKCGGIAVRPHCSNDATFTRLKKGEEEGIGADEKYMPVCRECFRLFDIFEILEAEVDAEELRGGSRPMCLDCRSEMLRDKGSFTKAVVLMPISNLY